jgi:hypothetical protein
MQIILIILIVIIIISFVPLWSGPEEGGAHRVNTWAKIGLAPATTSIVVLADHQTGETLSIKVLLDGDVLFSGKVGPQQIMPPVVFNKSLNLSGTHIVKFIDETRNLEEEKTFNAKETKTVVIKTEKKSMGSNITISSEKLYFK